MAMAMQQHLLCRRLEIRLEAAGLGFAGDEFLEQQRMRGGAFAGFARQHGQRLVAEGEETARLQPHQRHAAGEEGLQRQQAALHLGFRCGHIAHRQIGAATAERPR